MQPYFCESLWHSATVRCDGSVTCGLDDPFKQHNYGNIKNEKLVEIFNGPEIRQLRQTLLQGTVCAGCKMYSRVDEAAHRLLGPSHPYPHKLILEPTIKCNIRCNNTVCNIANDAGIRVRTEDFMSWPLFTKLMDEAGPHIKSLYFYHYGESFIHPKALDMLSYAKTLNPDLYVTTSTNGIPLAKDGMAERIVREGLVDWICFTIGGCDQETYGRYHKSASFEKAIEGMRNLVIEKRRQGASKPTIHWRYLMFEWNDSDEHIAEALRMKDAIGVDEFRFMLSYTPLESRSLRRAPGTPGFAAISDWVTYQSFYETDSHGEAGLWSLEDDPALGRFSWTSRRAMLDLPVDGPHAVLRLSRPAIAMMPATRATIRTPWGDQDATVGIGKWADNVIAVPPHHPRPRIPVTIEVDGVLSPFRVLGNTDHRDLGVMVSMDGPRASANPYR